MSDTLLWTAGVTQAITAMVAVAALSVSILSLYLQRRDKRPRLKINGSFSTLMDGNFNVIEHVYMISVANKGPNPATVTQLYLWYNRDWKFAFPDLRGEKPLPSKLGVEEGAKWWVDYEGLREGLRQSGLSGRARIRLEITDAGGGSYKKHETIILNAPWWRRRFFGFE